VLNASTPAQLSPPEDYTPEHDPISRSRFRFPRRQGRPNLLRGWITSILL